MIYPWDQDLRTMAIGTLHILKGRALIDFPGTTVAHPSIYVVVSLGIHGVLDDSYRPYFPFKVPWDLWDMVLTSVIVANPATAGTHEGEISKLMKLIEAGLIAKGFQTGTVSNRVLTDAGLGEPVLRGPLLEGDVAYPRIDPQLAWIEGHGKLDYPEID